MLSHVREVCETLKTAFHTRLLPKYTVGMAVLVLDDLLINLGNIQEGRYR
jgi:hypothetical protein